MSGTSIRCGVVSLAALDLRRRPDHRSEMLSQLLLGEVVDVLERPRRRPGWWRVRGRGDGYAGWVRTWGLIPASAARVRRWERAATARVCVPVAAASALPGRGAAVSPLFLNSRLIAGGVRAGKRAVELPDGRRGWVPRAALAPVGGPVPALPDRIAGLLGTPYLWGGRTPLGWDCSGYTQQVLVERGISLPRDAHEQFLACEALAASEAGQPGDLVFFGTPRARIQHVGMALGGGWFSDCRGRTRLASLDRGNPMCDRELAGQLRGYGRPRKRA